MLFGSRLMGGWRCAACGKTFYVDARDFKPAVSQWWFVSLFVAGALLPVFLVFAGVPIWVGFALFAVVVACLAATSLSMNAAQWSSMATYTTQPPGQRGATRLTLAAMIVFWSGWYIDFLLIQRFEATEPFHAVLTIICAIIAGVLMFRAWQIKRAKAQT